MNEISLTDAFINKAREALDVISWTIIDSSASPKTDPKGSKPPVLEINYLNQWLIDGMNHFYTEGLKEFFSNQEIVISGAGIMRIVDHKIDFPKKDDLGKPDELLWPNEARYGKLNYTGTLYITVEIEWDPRLRKPHPIETLLDNTSKDIAFCKLPIMLGSCLDNLSGLQRLSELEFHGECENDMMGYFIMSGEKAVISQNFQKVNNPNVIRIGGGSSNAKRDICTMNSGGIDYIMISHEVYISKKGPKENYSDSRIYVSMPMFTANVSDSSKNVVGVNIIDIYRLAVITLLRNDPSQALDSYRFEDKTRVIESQVEGVEDEIQILAVGGFEQVSTVQTAINLFKAHIMNAAGEFLYKKVQVYVDDTVNEALISKREGHFWKNISVVAMNNVDNIPRADKVNIALDRFAKSFMRHVSTPVLEIQLRVLHRDRLRLIEYIKNALVLKGHEPNKQNVNVTIRSMKIVSEQTDQTDQTVLEGAKRTLTQAGVQDFTIYNEAMTKYNVIQKDMISRLKLLIHMAIKLLRVTIGASNYDQRNDLIHQKFEHAGSLMMSRFAAMFRQEMSNFKSYDSEQTVDVLTIVTQIKKANTPITSGFAENFSSGEWNNKGAIKKRTGVVGPLARGPKIASISHLRRISAQSNEHNTNTASRGIKGLQVGSICLAQTPEGKQCGNVENLAMAAYVTTSLNMDSVDRLLNRMARAHLSELRTEKMDTPTFLNGKFIGFSNGLTLRKFLIQSRRQKIIHPHISVGFTQNVTRVGVVRELKIDTGSGRIVQPLIIAEDAEKIVKFAAMISDPRSKKMTFQQLIDDGWVEYVDAAELSFLDLAPSIDVFLNSVREGLPERYSHIMINPAFLYGAAANLQIYSNMNPAVRTAYASAQYMQPDSKAMATIHERAFSSISALNQPQEPIVKTTAHEKILGEESFGESISVLYAPHGAGEEDGIIMRRGFVERGGLRSMTYVTSDELEIQESDELKFDVSQEREDEQPGRYGRGIIRLKRDVTRRVPIPLKPGQTEADREYKVERYQVPVVVNPKDILARKTWFSSSEEVYKDIKFDLLRPAIMDQILFVQKTSSKRRLLFRMRVNNILREGDKLTTRLAQKGVITYIMPDEDMPYDAETGQIPDVIINPQSLPSRMTLGSTMEGLIGSLVVLPDKKKTLYIMYKNRYLEIMAEVVSLYLVDANGWANAGKSTTKKKEVVDDNPFGGMGFDMGFDMAEFARPSLPKVSEQVPIDTGDNIIISSADVFDDAKASWLHLNDKMPFPVHALEYRQGSIVEYVVIIEPGNDINELMSMLPKGWNAIIGNIETTKVTAVKGLWANTIDDDGDGPSYPMLGINISDIPDDKMINIKSRSARGRKASSKAMSYREAYLRINRSLPIASQQVSGYRDQFFKISNLVSQYYDFTIPYEISEIQGVPVVGEFDLKTIVIPPGTKYTDLKNIKYTLMLEEDAPGGVGQITVQKELNMLQILKMSDPSVANGSYIVPRENVIGLFPDARDIYIRRRERVESLRMGDAFKKFDVKDALEELRLMGHRVDGRREFIDGISGKVIRGGLVSGVHYFSTLDHRVGNKVQARGFGQNNIITRQPIPGRNRHGGLQFGQMDGLAAIKSGAENFVKDRLLDASSKQTVQICIPCKEVCYKEKGPGTIVCPLCGTSAEPVTVAIPYTALYARNLLMGALAKLDFVAQPAKK